MRIGCVRRKERERDEMSVREVREREEGIWMRALGGWRGAEG